MKILFLFTISFSMIFVATGCLQNNTKNLNVQKIYQCTDFSLNVPIVTVDAETNGRKLGDTHFPSSSGDGEVFYSYINFESDAEARKYFDEKNENLWFAISKGNLTDQAGRQVGEKIVSVAGLNAYSLQWVNGAKYSAVSSDSWSAVKEIERDCNL